MRHVVYIPFTGVGVPGMKSQDWLEARIAFFMKWTLQSLLHQNDRDFTLWISWRPEELGNPAVSALGDYLYYHTTLPFVFTYQGLMYHDDKFGGTVVQRAKNCARIVRQAWRTRNVQELTNIRLILHNKNKTLPTRLSIALESMWPFVDDTQDVLLTRIDSDDLFRLDAIASIKRCYQEHLQDHTKVDCILCTTGFIYDTVSARMAEWRPGTNPPFHTVVFYDGSFTDPQRHMERIKNYKSHEDAPTAFGRAASLESGMYCVTTREPASHISTIFNHPFRGASVDPALIKDFT